MRIDFVLTWKRAAGALALMLVLALAVGWSGLVPIAASSGHLPPIRWFLGFTMRNAVERQSLLVEKPVGLDLGDPMLVRRAAGHFATGCAPCHGAPGVPQSPVVDGMSPSPPRLEERIGRWDDEALFWIVRNGIGYSGMPAWPARERDDEVWAQVAFLRALPQMSAERYAELALGDGDIGMTLAGLGARQPEEVERALADCARCHGRDGLGRGEGAAQGAFPIIAGQPEAYLYATLLAFRDGRRRSGFMQPPARRYEPEILRELATHYADQPRPPAATAAPVAPPVADLRMRPVAVQDEAGHLDGAGSASGLPVPLPAPVGPPDERRALLDLGRRIALDGLRVPKVPSCESCHGATATPPRTAYPYLAGQPEWYLETHLELWHEDERGGTAYSRIMSEIARHLTAEQIEAVSAWYATRQRPVP